MKDVSGVRTPLITAIMEGDLSLVSLLLEWRADVNKKASVCLANTHVHTRIRDIINPGILDLDSSSPVYSLCPLHSAAIAGNVDIAASLCNAGANLNAMFPTMNADWGSLHGVTALHLAVALGNIDMVGLLLDHGADIESMLLNRNHELVAPLGISALTSTTEIVTFLLKRGACPEPEHRFSHPVGFVVRSPMAEACWHKKKEMVRHFLSHSVDVDLGRSLVHALRAPSPFRPKHGSDLAKCPELMSEVMTLLTVNGADVNSHIEGLDTPLQAALRHCCTVMPDLRTMGFRCARKLIELGANINAAALTLFE